MKNKKYIALPLALKPLHCLSGSPCLTSCLLLLLLPEKGLKLTARNLLALAYKHHVVRVFYVPDLLVDGVKAEQLSPSQAQ